MVKVIFNFGKFLGISTPWKENETPLLKLLRKVYDVFLIFLTVFAIIFSGFQKYYGFWTLLPNITQIILEILQFLAELCFFLSCFLGSILKTSNWKEIFSIINQIDRLLSQDNITTKVGTFCYVLSFSIIHICYVTLHAYELLSRTGEEDESMEYGYILDRVHMYYQFYLTTLIYLLNMMLKRRYRILEKVLLNLLERKKMSVIICQEANRQFITKLVHMKDMYANLHLIVANFNKILGWPIFFIIVSNVLLCLININYVFIFSSTSNSPSFNVAIFISAGLYTGVYTVSTLIITRHTQEVRAIWSLKRNREKKFLMASFTLLYI